MAELTTGDDGNAPLDGVQIDLISTERMEGLRTMEKIHLILDGVRDGNIVILERGLDPEEESKLTVIGPANRIETLHKDENLIRTLIRRR